MTDHMTEERAREILATWNPGSDKAPANGSSTSYAQGYLQALEDERAKAKGLVEACEAVDIYFKALVEQWAANDGRVISESGTVIAGSKDVERLCEIAGQKVQTALARYRNSPGKNSPS